MADERIRLFSTKKLREGLEDDLHRRPDILFTSDDFIRIIPLNPDPAAANIISASSAVVLTSANAVAPLAAAISVPQAASLRIYCLQGATREAVIDAFGEGCIRGTAPHGAALAEEIIAQGISGPVAFFCGDIRRDELPQMLRAGGIGVIELVVYATRPVAREMPFTPDAVLFFSPSAVDSFFNSNKIPGAAVCVAIGATTEGAIRRYAAENIILTASQPTQDAVLETLFLHLQRTSLERANQ